MIRLRRHVDLFGDRGRQLQLERNRQRIGHGERALFRAVVKDSGQSVCLLELRADEVPFFASAKRADHAHLARLHLSLGDDGRNEGHVEVAAQHRRDRFGAGP